MAELPVARSELNASTSDTTSLQIGFPKERYVLSGVPLGIWLQIL
jgi:hypothetical protein